MTSWWAWLLHELYLAYRRRLNFWILVANNEDIQAAVAVCFVVCVLWAEITAVRRFVRFACVNRKKRQRGMDLP